MRRLSGSDALLLSLESGTAYQHLGGLVLLDAPGGEDTAARIRQTVADRLHLVPTFTWRVKEVPLHLDRPVWVQDDSFDLDRHVKRTAVPAPGGRAELGDLVGRLAARKLDRRHPLWQLWIIEGVGGSGVAVYLKHHQCLTDGQTGTSLVDRLFDLEPAPALPPPGDREPSPGEPSSLELLARGVLSTGTVPLKVAGYLRGAAARTAVVLWNQRKAQALLGLSAPPTLLNGALGPNRQLVLASLALADLKDLRRELDVKLNDVVLSLVAGALRAFLLEQGELPDGPLTAVVPVASEVVGPDQDRNRITTTAVSLPTHLADPLERVHAVFAGTAAAKAMLHAVRARSLQSIGEVAPPLLLNLAARTVQTQTVAGRLPTSVSLVVANMPGPSVPLHLAGMPVTAIFSCSVLMANLGCAVSVLSYQDRVDVAVTVDPDLLPSAHRLGELLPQALAELRAACGLGEPTPVPDLFAPVRA